MMQIIAAGAIGLVVGVLCCELGWIAGKRSVDRSYRSFIEQYLKAEKLIHAHIRDHVLRDKDFTWAAGCAPIVTFGIKEDFSLMADEELQEARKLAGLD